MFKLIFCLGACIAAASGATEFLKKEAAADAPKGHVGTCNCADGAPGMLGEKDECICKSHSMEVKPHMRHEDLHAVAPTHLAAMEGTVTTPTTPNPNIHQTTMGSQIAIIITGALLSIGLLTLIVYGFITLTQIVASDTTAI